jgi:hypothetical protein
VGLETQSPPINEIVFFVIVYAPNTQTRGSSINTVHKQRHTSNSGCASTYIKPQDDSRTAFAATADGGPDEEKFCPTKMREVATVEGSCIGQPYTQLLVLNTLTSHHNK